MLTAYSASLLKEGGVDAVQVPPSPLSSLLSHLPHLNKPEVVKSMGHAPVSELAGPLSRR